MPEAGSILYLLAIAAGSGAAWWIIDRQARRHLDRFRQNRPSERKDT